MAYDHALGARSGPPGVTAPQAASGRTRLIFLLGSLEGLVFGYDNGVIAGALLFIRKAMALTPAMQGLVVSALMAGAIIAAPISGKLGDRLGGPRLIAVAGGMFLLGSLGAALAPNPAILIGFRLVLGIGIGIGTVQVPMYLAELSPAASRGALTSLYQLMIAIGIFIAYLVGYGFSWTGNWRMMIGAGAVPAALLILGATLLPNSPRWLVRRGRIDEARRVLGATRSAEAAERELLDIRNLVRTTRLSLGDLVRDPWLKRVLVIALCLAVFQQALGINTIVYYTPTILQSAGFGPSSAILTGGSLQILSIAMTFLLGRIVDRAGRRILLMLGALVMATSMALLGLIFASGLLSDAAGSTMAVACLAIFKAAFSASWGPVVWIAMPELLPLRARGAAMGCCVLTTFCVNVLISSLFPILLASGPAIAFGAFAAAGLLACLVVHRLLPETAGRTLEQIEAAGRARCRPARAGA